MLFLDLTHTSHTRARTGIQRVTRSLALALDSAATSICLDPYLGAWRRLNPREQAGLAVTGVPGGKRGARWPWRSRLYGSLRRLLGHGPAPDLVLPTNSSGLIVPELFSPMVAAALPALKSRVRGPAVAVFHDAIALRLPELSPPKTVARFPAYLQELQGFDGIAATSEDSRAALLDYWRWLGDGRTPPVAAIPLGIEKPPPNLVRPEAPVGADPVILSVGSIEGRKNHGALLDAAEQLWASGRRFTLQLVGLAQLQTGREALRRIQALQAAGRPLRYEGPIDDTALHAAYAGCLFTVYPSLMEGFGLPVLESLAHGRPCVCSGRGALGESAAGGGCVTLETVDSPALAGAIEELLAAPEKRMLLAEAARRRPVRTWSDYATDLGAWLENLRGRHPATA